MTIWLGTTVPLAFLYWWKRWTAIGSNPMLIVLCPPICLIMVVGDLLGKLRNKYNPKKPKRSVDAFGSKEILLPLGKDPHYRDFVVGRLGEPWPDKKTAELRSLASDYHRRCEEYDRTVCTGPIKKDGGIRPANSSEFLDVNCHSRKVFKELWEKAKALGATPDEWMRAVRDTRPRPA